MVMSLPPARILALVASIGIASSCVESQQASESATVATARKALLGLSEVDIRMCAGFPSRTVDIQSGQIWTYERTVNSGGLNVSVPTFGLGTVPVPGGSVNVASGGYCNTQVRFTNGKVVEIAYAGDNDLPRRRNALCTSIVDECVIYARTPHPNVRDNNN
jgi:hypothetical protein